MKGDFHVRFRENAGVKFPCVTRLGASGERHSGGERLKANSGNDYREVVTRKLAVLIPLQKHKMIFLTLRGKTLAKPLERDLHFFSLLKGTDFKLIKNEYFKD